MNGAQAVAEVLKREGVEYIFCFPQNPLIDAAAGVGIRPLVAREERTAIGMADAYSRMNNGKRIGVCMIQYGPGAEHGFGSIAQAFGDSSPILVIPGGVPRGRIGLRTSFDSVEAYRPITKWASRFDTAASVPDQMRRAFAQLRSGRLGPVLLEMPADVVGEEFDDALFSYEPPRGAKAGPDPEDVTAAIEILLGAKHPVLYVGAGVLSAGATPELVTFAELLGVPVMSTYIGKSGFPEDHPLSIGAGGNAVSAGIAHFLPQADCVFTIGSSLHNTLGACAIPRSATIVQCTADGDDLSMEYPIARGVLGDAKITLAVLTAELRKQRPQAPSSNEIETEIAAVRTKARNEWAPMFDSAERPINPYRLVSDIMKTVDRARTIITHDSGYPRDQLAPIYEATVPHGYLGWGNSTPLGASLGLAIGAKIACPDKVVVCVLGDGAFGQVGIDVETTIREKFPIVIVLINNSEFGNYEKNLPVAEELYRIKHITGRYMEIAEALGAHARRVEDPDEIIPALKDAIAEADGGRTALIEIITRAEPTVRRV